MKLGYYAVGYLESQSEVVMLDGGAQIIFWVYLHKMKFVQMT